MIMLFKQSKDVLLPFSSPPGPQAQLSSLSSIQVLHSYKHKNMSNLVKLEKQVPAFTSGIRLEYIHSSLRKSQQRSLKSSAS